MSNFYKVEQKINELGYYFIDKNIQDIYKDVNQKYNIIDNNGYKYYCCLKHLIKNKLPSIVGNGNPYSIENIKTWIINNEKRFDLLSKLFENSHTYLDLKCKDCDAIFQRTWNDLKNGIGCRNCRYNNQRILQMKPRLKHSKPLSFYADICLDWSNENKRPYTDYSSGSGFKAMWKCHECNYKWETSISHRTLNNSGCPKCSNKMSKAEKYIYEYLTKNNIVFF